MKKSKKNENEDKRKGRWRGGKERGREDKRESTIMIEIFASLRTSEIHLFYNLQLFYWHFLEILWLFIFLVLYLSLVLFLPSAILKEQWGRRRERKEETRAI